MLGHLGTDKPRQWTDLFPEWQPPPSPHVSLLSSSRTLLLLRVQGCERACDLREAAWQLRIFSAGAQSLKERRIETEGGKVQGGDTACLRSFLLKRSYNFLFEGWLSVQESPAEEERQGRIRWGGGDFTPRSGQTDGKSPEHVELQPRVWAPAPPPKGQLSFSLLPSLFPAKGTWMNHQEQQKWPLNHPQGEEVGG